MFLLRPDPEQDESLESYLIRLSELNHFRIRNLFPHFGKLLKKQHGQLAGSMPSELGRFNLYHAYSSSSKRYWALHLLSERCCKDRLPMLELAVLKTDRRFAGHHTALIWKGIEIPRLFFRSKNIPVCPQCLQEKPYIPVFWHISLVRACPRHQSSLVFKCPQCGLDVDYIRDEAVLLCQCGFDLSTATSEPGDPKLIKLAEQVYGFEPESSEADNLLFRKLTTEAVFGAVLWFMQWVDEEGCHSSQVSEGVLFRCTDYFDNWPARLFAQLDELAHDGLEYSVRSMRETAFHSIFGSLLKVSRNLPDSRLATNAILKAVFSFLDRITFQEGHQYAEISQTLLDSFEACVILGTGTRQVARLVEEGLLHPCKQQKDKKPISAGMPLFRLRDVFVLWSVGFQSRHSNRSLYLPRW
ncbi:TniQ family protein [Endozoicomonas gorgoniicola]|uniref:TniQ family protein n=1 Tax=Endozoicomonas gorgoniicola TaxID=1234144 RepID=A0ABT3N2R5_9GAMM|nr:TniQ family protein [Endozoicomonas gorgoniicola]MCW7555911.1 TniQ family protein [Endozoicomonas gorgoniicola]